MTTAETLGALGLAAAELWRKRAEAALAEVGRLRERALAAEAAVERVKYERDEARVELARLRYGIAEALEGDAVSGIWPGAEGWRRSAWMWRGNAKFHAAELADERVIRQAAEAHMMLARGDADAAEEKLAIASERHHSVLLALAAAEALAVEYGAKWQAAVERADTLGAEVERLRDDRDILRKQVAVLQGDLARRKT